MKMIKVNFLNVLGLIVSLVLLMQRGEATTFTVGGSKGWSVPSGNASVYNQWAEKMRFQIGDSLPASDSVLQVTKDDYNNCTTSSPIAKFTDGHTKVKFNKSGPYYFISGNKHHCLKNQKLVVVVLADRSGSKNSPPSHSTSTTSPAASPPSDVGSTPAPSAEAKPPKNGAASLAVMSFVASLGAFVGSCVFLVF